MKELAVATIVTLFETLKETIRLPTWPARSQLTCMPPARRLPAMRRRALLSTLGTLDQLADRLTRSAVS